MNTYKLAIAMLTKHIRIDTVWCYFRFLREYASQSRGIKRSAGTQDLRLG